MILEFLNIKWEKENVHFVNLRDIFFRSDLYVNQTSKEMVMSNLYNDYPAPQQISAPNKGTPR